MMSFELPAPTKAKVLEVYVLSQKNRKPDEDPGAKISLQVLVGNDVLTGFHGKLKSDLFTRDADSHPPTGPEAQRTLDGVPIVSDLPDLTWLGAHVKTIRLSDSLSGYRLRIDHGIGGRSSITIDDCTLSDFRLQAQKGGTVLVKFELESPNVSDKTWGKLARLKSLEVEIALQAPAIDQGGDLASDGEGRPWPDDKRDAPATSADATAVFLAQHGKGAAAGVTR
jgi:hypothetical protein